MAQEEFDQAAEYRKKYSVTHHATVDDVQKALHLIVQAGFDVDAMAPEYGRIGREALDRISAKHPEFEFEDATEHGYYFRRDDERLMLTWNYVDDTAEITWDRLLPGESMVRIGNSRNFSLPEFAAYISAGPDVPAQHPISPVPGI